MQRFFQKLTSSVRIAALGDGLYHKCRIFALLYWVPVYRRMYKKNLPAIFNLRKNNQSFKVSLNGSHEDLLILDEILVREEYKVPLREASVIFDLGGNIGLSALYFSLMYPKASVYSFEPGPHSYERLISNVQARPQISTYRIALTSYDGQVKFYENKSKPIASSLSNRGDEFDEIVVECWSLETALSRVAVQRIDVLKFDIEGSEYELFREFKQFERVRYIVGEVHEDLMDATLDNFLELLKPYFDLTVQPAKKPGRYVVRGYNRSKFSGL